MIQLRSSSLDKNFNKALEILSQHKSSSLGYRQLIEINFPRLNV